MAEGKNGDGRTVRVMVRIMVPVINRADGMMLELAISELLDQIEGATYEVTISSPRSERPR